MNNNTRLIYRQILFVGICTVFFSYANAQSGNYQSPDPQIKAGIARVSGTILNLPQEITSLTLYFENPVTAEQRYFETNLKEDGSFYFEVPVECSVFYGFLGAKGYSGGFIPLSTYQETKLELRIDNAQWKIFIKADGIDCWDKVDLDKYPDILYKYSVYRYATEPFYEMTFQGFAHFEMEMMKTRTEYALKGIELSTAARTFITNNLKLLHLKGRLLTYKESMEYAFLSINGKEKAASFSPKEPDITYYSFLKSFNLNDPQYIYCTYYSNVMQYILTSKALNIPPIADTPVDEWLSGVKATLANLVGFDSGQFYDMLAANAYSKQFKDEQIPLSDMQKENIRNYYSDGEIAKILLRRNEDIIKLAAGKSPLVINETPSVPKEKLMEAIISKYKGKVVVVDFWATWCQPCREAMPQIRNLKSELKGKDVVSVYMTNGSSPKKLWSEVIKTINGEHYYLSGEEWGYIMDGFGFEGIPSYLIYDTKGELKHKFTGYPGNTSMREMIEGLLP